MKSQLARYFLVPILVFMLSLGSTPVSAAPETETRHIANLNERAQARDYFEVDKKTGQLGYKASVGDRKTQFFRQNYNAPKERAITTEEVGEFLPPSVIKNLDREVTMQVSVGAMNEVNEVLLFDRSGNASHVLYTAETDVKTLQPENLFRLKKPENIPPEEVEEVEQPPAFAPTGPTPPTVVTEGKKPPAEKKEPPTRPTPTPEQPCYFYYNAPLGYFPGAMRGPQPVDAGFVQKLMATYGVSGVQQGLGLSGNTFANAVYNNMKWQVIPVPCDLEIPAPPVAQPPAPPVTPPAPPVPPEEPELVQICWFDPFTGSVAWTGTAVVGGEFVDSPAPGYNPMGFYGGTTITFPPGVTPFPYGPVTTTVVQTPYGTSYTVTCGYIPEEFLPPQPEPPQPPQPPQPPIAAPPAGSGPAVEAFRKAIEDIQDFLKILVMRAEDPKDIVEYKELYDTTEKFLTQERIDPKQYAEFVKDYQEVVERVTTQTPETQKGSDLVPMTYLDEEARARAYEDQVKFVSPDQVNFIVPSDRSQVPFQVQVNPEAAARAVQDQRASFVIGAKPQAEIIGDIEVGMTYDLKTGGITQVNNGIVSSRDMSAPISVGPPTLTAVFDSALVEGGIAFNRSDPTFFPNQLNWNTVDGVRSFIELPGQEKNVKAPRGVQEITVNKTITVNNPDVTLGLGQNFLSGRFFIATPPNGGYVTGVSDVIDEATGKVVPGLTAFRVTYENGGSIVAVASPNNINQAQTFAQNTPNNSPNAVGTNINLRRTLLTFNTIFDFQGKTILDGGQTTTIVPTVVRFGVGNRKVSPQYKISF